MFVIEKLHAREVLDSRGLPTVEVEVTLKGGAWGRAAVPSGASTGSHEAWELRDGDRNRYLGKGVSLAVANVNQEIQQALSGMSLSHLTALDHLLLEIDGTPQKKRLGANAILGVSMATGKALASAEKIPLFLYLNKTMSLSTEKPFMPIPLVNVLNGGAHANNGLDVQEFMIVPRVSGGFKEQLRVASEVFQNLKKILAEQGMSTAVGDEGGFAPKLPRNEEALRLLMAAIEKSGYQPMEDVALALDVAATEFFREGVYHFEGRKMTREELVSIYIDWQSRYPIISIEDGCSEDDWDGWRFLTHQLGARVQLVGDDLFVTNPERITRGIEHGSANALLVKANQIGTLTETYQAVALAHKNGWKTVMSHRSGETEDVTIAHLAVGWGSHQIKTGSVCRGERTAKYNELLRIEELIS